MNQKARSAIASRRTALHRVLKELEKLAPEEGLIEIGEAIVGDKR